MPTAKEVATWMFTQFDRSNYLCQDDTVYKIKKKFGKDFVYDNENGNLAIEKSVLKEFRRITEGKVVWERSEKAWRKLRPTEKYKGRQVD
jgi:hypothetical protein